MDGRGSGHTRSWGKSHPELLAKCYENGQETPHYGGLDPTKQETLDFLSALFEEIVGLFPDAVVHMGFDEVEFACWQSNPFIKQYMIANRFPTSFDLLDSFTTRLLDRVQKAAKRVSRGGQRSFIFWQDAFDSGLNLPNNTIIHLWKNIYARPVYFGHKVIISAGWYLDLVEYSVGWVSLYTSEFFMDRFSSFHSDHKVIDVIGGEACMWAEWQSDETVLQRIWPMTSAVAERLWYHGTPNVDEFAKRLAEQHCRLLRRGIPASVVNGPGMCPLPLDAAVLGQGTFSGLAVTAGIRVPRCLELGSTTALLSLGLLAFLTGLLLGALGILTRISQAIILLSDSVASRFKERRFAQRLVACSVVLATFLFLLLFHTDTRAGTI
ncbi:unnamed protein product [Mesocestoides corti]|uniref:beta-N-acetylhexosaminidase n=2 Tax=Mesocestoides corti TaxID=53468 RepID=A0A158QVQ0_MESCO|nr:unnamed protein product [Mesocestoides corti]